MTRLPPTAGTRLLAAAVIVTLTVAACDDTGPTDAPPASPSGAFTGRLAVLAGAPGSRQLVAYDAGGAAEAVDLPPGEVTWVSADARGAVAATTADGGIQVAVPGPADWAQVDLGTTLDRAGGLPLMATWSADGRLAAIVGDLDTARMAGLLVVDPGTDGTLLLPLDTGLEGSPPAWLDDDRIAVPARDRDVPGLVVVQILGGAASPVPGRIRSVVASPDGATVALTRGDALEVEVWRSGPLRRAWADGVTPPADALLATLRAPAGLVRTTAMSLDATGDRLAVAWGDADGASSTVTVHAEGGDWHEVVRFAIRRTPAVPALAWLP